MKVITMTATPAIGIAQGMTSPAGGRFPTLHMIAGTLNQWRARAVQRRHLREIDDHLLVDMGLSRADVERESRKPFWQA